MARMSCLYLGKVGASFKMTGRDVTPSAPDTLFLSLTERISVCHSTFVLTLPWV